MNCLYLLLLLCCCNRRNYGNNCGMRQSECCGMQQNCECAAVLARNERSNVKREERRTEERWERDSLPRPFPPFPDKRDCDCDSGV